MRLSAVLITLNEERNLPDCLRALTFCDEIVVVDSGSRDRTAPIAREAGAAVFERPFDDFASQKNFALSRARGEWVLLMDADERVSEGLAREILQAIGSERADAYWMPRQNRIFGRVLRHGANAGDRQMRLARRSLARFEGVVHERLVVPERTGSLQIPIDHHSTPTVSEYMRKLNQYTGLEASMAAAPKSAARLSVRALAVWLRDYGWKAGFLDGLEGFLFASFSAYYTFIKQMKAWETSREKK